MLFGYSTCDATTASLCLWIVVNCCCYLTRNCGRDNVIEKCWRGFSSCRGTKRGDILPYDVGQKPVNLSSVSSSAPTIGPQKILSLEIHRVSADGDLVVAGEHGGDFAFCWCFFGTFVGYEVKCGPRSRGYPHCQCPILIIKALFLCRSALELSRISYLKPCFIQLTNESLESNPTL